MQTAVNVRKRLVLAFFILAMCLFIIMGRVAWLQFVRGSELQEKALNNRLNIMPVAPQRGVIYDRNGHELAISMATDYIGAFPQEIKDSGRAEEIARQLATILEMSTEEVYEKITRNSGFEFIARQVEFSKSQQIKDLRLTGIEVVPENRRYYPNGPLAAHVLGFCGIDNQGLEGLEVMYDSLLAGEAGKIVLEFDALAHEIPGATHRYIPPKNGHSLVLTIDQTIQYIAERELDKIMASPTKPRRANIIVMDPKTGEILAMAGRPTFDPNNYSKFPDELWGNPLARDAYEPGSAFKIITAAIALEEGVVTPGDGFYDPGYIKVGPDTVQCWLFPMGHGSQTFADGVRNSCNPVFVQTALRIEEKKSNLFYDYLYAFGFGQPTGIDLTGEGAGLLIPREELKPINIATIGIGQGIAVTPVQIVTAVSAVANGGRLMRPQLVKEIRAEGESPIVIKPEVVRQVISPATSKALAEMLESVVSEGTGRNAYIEGYRVAGKTGTAQKAGPGGYMEGKYVASFIGYAPANDPRLVALVTIDEPQGYPYYGGTLAAPIFKAVVEDALHYLQVPPQYNSEQKSEIETPALVPVPDVVGQDIKTAQAALQQAGLEARLEGEGNQVVAQVPKAGAVVTGGSKVMLYLQGSPQSPSVPDVTGLRVGEAAEVLEAYGLGLVPQGSGQAAEQNPVPGTPVPVGSRVTVKFFEPAQETLGP